MKLAPAALAATLGLAASAQAAPESIVVFAHGVSSRGEQALVGEAGGHITRRLHIINAVGATLTPAEATRLRHTRHVVSVTPNSRMETTATAPSTSSTQCTASQPLCASALNTSYIQSAMVDSLWNDKTWASTGSGVGVAVVDTGIDGNLPDFQVSQSDASSRVVASVVTNPSATSAADLYGHGTHVAGILAGNGDDLPLTDPNHGRYIGVAPNANLISVKASDDAGNASEIDVINGLQWIVDNQAAYKIKVVNLSLSASAAQSYHIDPLDAAVEQAWLHGITVVVAAGNRGTAPDAVSYAPANDPYVITVGAVDDYGTKQMSDDLMSAWSSRGVTQDGFTKPDIYAPGEHIVAPLAPGSAFASLCPSCVRNTSYFQVSGTSMASPVVAGVAADLLAVHPTWTPTQVKSALIYQGRGLGNGALEVAADSAALASSKQLGMYTGAGLTPNTLITPSTGSIDYTKASWTKASWTSTDPTSPLSATWAKASWTCLSCSSASTTTSSSSLPTKASWTVFFGDVPAS
jgi:serine protease AprX